MTLKKQLLNSAPWPNRENGKWRHNYMQWPLTSSLGVLLRCGVHLLVHVTCTALFMYTYTWQHGNGDRDFALGWKLHVFTMPQSCVVGGCSRNTSKNPGVSFLSFPKAKSVRRQWIRFVKNRRSDFVLTEWSKVCSEHFTADCLDSTFRAKQSLGIKANFCLKPEAVPTIKASKSAPSSASSKSNGCHIVNFIGDFDFDRVVIK